jgi:hypothetical protein
MHLHLPKPVHGWREFLNEVAIIVVGISIALGAENIVERMRWAGEAAHATHSVKEELEGAAINAWERTAVQPCLNARLRYLTDAVAQNHGPWKAAPMLQGGSLRAAISPTIYMSPHRPYSTDAWQTVLSSGVYGHLGVQRAANLSSVYQLIRDLSQIQDQEDAAEARLSPLGYDVNLSDDAKIQMLEALGNVDRLNTFMTLVANQYIRDLKRVKLSFNPTEVAKDRRAILTYQRKARGLCVTDPPLDLN